MTQASHLEGKGVGAVTAPHWLRQLGRDSTYTLTILPLAVAAVVLVATLVSVGIDRQSWLDVVWVAVVVLTATISWSVAVAWWGAALGRDVAVRQGRAAATRLAATRLSRVRR